MKRIFVEGQETSYSVTEDGKIWSFKTMKFLKPHINDCGYEIVTISYCNINGERIQKQKKIHRLVAEAYVKNNDPEKNKVVNHIDENKSNNHKNNLEWCTPSTNTRKSTKLQKNRTRKKIVAINIKTGDSTIYASQAEAAKNLPIKTRRINDVLRGYRKTSLGYRFEYVNQEEGCRLKDVDLTESKQIYGSSKYYIFNDGRVYSKHRQRFRKASTASGYLRVQLMSLSKTKHYLIHHLVADHFIKPKEYRIKNNFVVNHKNGDKKDNRQENLELCTRSENTKHYHRELKNNKRRKIM